MKQPALFLMIIILSSLWAAGNPTTNDDSNILSYSELETLPEFPGGDKAMNEWIDRNMIYPDKAMKGALETTLIVSFIVSSDGSVRNADVKHIIGREDLFVNEAKRLFESMPKWIPATSNGKTVSAYFTKPIYFRIKKRPRNPNIIERNPYLTWNGKPYKMSEVPKLPKYPGGTDAMYSWIADNIIYPAEAVKAKIEGKVIVEFVISETGSVENPKIIKSVNPSLDKEALRIIGAMPRWDPGYSNGNPVKTSFIVPVTFRLVKDR